MNVWRCERSHDERFVCEQHLLMPWPHGLCAGSGVPCPTCGDEAKRRDRLAGSQNRAGGTTVH